MQNRTEGQVDVETIAMYFQAITSAYVCVTRDGVTDACIEACGGTLHSYNTNEWAVVRHDIRSEERIAGKEGSVWCTRSFSTIAISRERRVHTVPKAATAAKSLVKLYDQL